MCFFVAVLFASVFCMGCGAGDKATVKGVVNIKGAPLNKGENPTIAFIPMVEGKPVSLMLDSNGAFEGPAPIGKVKVTINAYPSPAAAGIAKKYTTVETTTLEAEITSGGPNEFTFEAGE